MPSFYYKDMHMSLNLAYCVDRAREAREQADSATLENVRDRCLRSVKAWEEMAARAQKVQRSRHAREAAAENIAPEQA